METIPGYHLIERLHESLNSLVYRGRRQSDKQPVILKLLKDVYPSPERIAWFRHEYDVTRGLNLPGVVKAYALELMQRRWVMVLEDFGGDSLARLGLMGRLDMAEVLRLAITLTDTLGQLHYLSLMHKDINPANVIYNRDTSQIKLIDFGISTLLSRETPSFCNPNVLEGTLVYMSPEQTGRMNRAIDYRTDFYSLGVTLYELVTGHLPFLSDDPLELVHSHIARQPIPPHQLRSDIPAMLSTIVLKLMAKNAEDRYQSAYGLKADLEECLRQWQRRGKIEPFAPGQYDVSDRLFIPQKLYGREAEVAALLAAFERVGQGSSELVLVVGAAGIGKSALVREVHRPVTRQRGYFIAGKFDQFQRDTPYAALIQAFRALLHHLLTESDSEINHWRQRLLQALGSNGQVITDIIPELALIIGPQPAVPELPPTEARNRLNLAFQQFIQVFTQPEHPLVLFLDDMQWADSTSLHLLSRLLTGTNGTRGAGGFPLLVIAAYRHNEVDAAHPLHQMLQTMQEAGATMHTVQLAPLAAADVARLVADTLHCEESAARPLAELVTAKTDGNPFFVTTFLKALYVKGLLSFDHVAGRWQWDSDQIQAEDMTDNVAELLVEEVQRLDAQSQALLQQAACIGHRFDLATLALVAQQSPSETAHHLQEALTAGLILPLNEAYKLVQFDVPGLAEQVNVEYAFTHDRVQQAVYALLPTAERQAIHWRIGQLLLQSIPPEQRDDHLFDLVAHLNQGRQLSSSQAEQTMLAALNLDAGKKAKAAAAYEAALAYLSVGVELLGAEGWQQYYDLALALHTHMAAAAYLSGDIASMERLTPLVLERARSLLDKLDIYEVNIQAYAARHQFLEAIRSTLPALRLLGIDIPEQPTQEDTAQRMAAIHAMLAEQSIEAVCDLPAMNDPHHLAAMRMLASLFSVAYIGAPTLMPVVVCEQVLHSLKYGHAPASPFAYANYGLMLCGMLDDIETGAQFGALALRLLEILDERAYRAKTLVTVNFFITHWTHHARETLAPLLAGYHSGLETGDFEYAGYAAYMHTCHAFLIGHEMAAMPEAFARNNKIFAQLQQERTRQQNGLYWQVVVNLLGQTPQPTHIQGNYYNEEEALPVLQAANDVPSLANISFNKMLLCYLFQQYEEAATHADQLEQYLAGLIGSLFMPLFYFYDSLVRLALLPEQPPAPDTHALAPPEHNADLLARVAANQQKLAQWAQHAPANCLHRWHLVDAEQARVQGRHGAAREAYDQAIHLAQQHGYLNEEALAQELAGRFYLRKGDEEIAYIYLRRAHYAYMRWGALAKLRQMEQQYSHLVTSFHPEPVEHARVTTRVTTNSLTGGTTVQSLDLSSVVKVSQMISGEIFLETLLEKLMHTVLENAGARRGLLILGKIEAWVVEAEGIIDQDVTVLQSIPLAEAAVPQTVINYVVRTRESVVLNDAAQEGAFTGDSYISRAQPRSILCTPLIHQGSLTGLLYLENNQTVGAFTADRLEVLNLLSSQIAISIENASLYAHLEDLVRARTAELSQAYATVKALNERMHDEMNLARRIQESLLPPERPQWPRLDIECYTVPAREVGGDLYAYHAINEQHGIIAVGDVSGKGMPAALLMAVSVASFRYTVGHGWAPAEFLAYLDRSLADYTRTTHQNCALVYVDISAQPHDPARWLVRAANAGCVTPIVRRSDGTAAWVDIGGMPLGIGFGAALGYEEHCLELQQGDMLILTSDGVIEAQDAAGELFGFERLEAAVIAGPRGSAAAMLQHIQQAVNAFVGDTEPHDDLTIVVVHI